MCQSLEKVMLQKLQGLPTEEIVISGPGAAKRAPKPKAVSAPATSSVTPVTPAISNHVPTDTPALAIDEPVNSSMQLPLQPIKVGV